MRTAQAATAVALAPDDALALWTDLRRWPAFIEGFARVVEASPEWPRTGSTVVWESIPAGRGRVTEKVTESEGGTFSTRVFDESLVGTQILIVEPSDEGSRMELCLRYELNSGGPMRALSDLIFIRRALRDSLRRTLRRFAVEAEEEAGLR